MELQQARWAKQELQQEMRDAIGDVLEHKLIMILAVYRLSRSRSNIIDLSVRPSLDHTISPCYDILLLGTSEQIIKIARAFGFGDNMEAGKIIVNLILFFTIQLTIFQMFVLKLYLNYAWARG